MNDRSEGSPKTPSIIATGGSIVVGGDANDATFRTGGDDIHIHGTIDLERFRAELTRLRAAATTAGLDAGAAETIEGEIVDVETEAVKPKPNKTKILDRLDIIARVAAAATTVGDKLVPTARALGEMAARLF